MKRIFTLLASLILTISVFAEARPKSTLTIQSTEMGDIRVVIDGRRFEPNDNFMRIQGLEAGSHQVKIYVEKRNGMYSIFGKKYQVVYNTILNIKPRANMSITVDRFGRASVTETRTRGGYGNGRNWDRDNDFEYDRGSNRGDYGNDRNDRNGQWDNHYGYERGMDDREFDLVVQSIEKEWLESNKLKSATHVAQSNKLTSAQVKELMLLFSFESNKLDVAKQAYANTVDKKNFSIVNDAFSFNSSRDDLARFIRNFR